MPSAAAPVGEARIDPATCQVNLLQHVNQMQTAMMARLDTIERHVEGECPASTSDGAIPSPLLPAAPVQTECIHFQLQLYWSEGRPICHRQFLTLNL